MSKTFRAWKIDEPLFLPPTVQDFVAEDHLARFVLSLVRDDLDLIEISGKKAGLVKLGHVALDGTKIKANASKHKAMSYERMKKRAAKIGRKPRSATAQRGRGADVEQEAHGRDKTGYEMPEWVAKRRAATIRKAKEIEDERSGGRAQAQAEAEAQEKREAEGAGNPDRKPLRLRPSPTRKPKRTSPIPTAGS